MKVFYTGLEQQGDPELEWDGLPPLPVLPTNPVTADGKER